MKKLKGIYYKFKNCTNSRASQDGSIGKALTIQPRDLSLIPQNTYRSGRREPTPKLFSDLPTHTVTHMPPQ